MKGKFIGLGYGVIALWVLWPIFSLLLAAGIASANGCTVNEGGVYPCIVYGRDIGSLLYSMTVSGWYALITIPSGLMAALVFTVFVVIMTVVRRNKRIS